MSRWILLFILNLSWIVSAQISGIDKLPAALQKKIRKELPQLQTGAARGKDYDQLIKMVMRTGKYENVWVIRKNKKVSLKYKKVRILKGIQFVGNNHFSQQQLTDILDVPMGEKFGPKILQDSAFKLKEFYGQQGYLKAKITADVINGKSTEVTLQLKITENSITTIRKVDFITKNRSLKSDLKQIAKDLLEKPLRESDINKLTTELIQFLTENRYYTTQMTDPQLSLNNDRAKLTYRLSDEYQYSVNFVGNVNLSGVRDEVSIGSVSSSMENFVPEIENRIKQTYLKNGFAKVKVRTETRTEAKDFERELRFIVTEGPRIQIRNISITGRYSQSPQVYEEFIRENSSELIEDGYYNKEDLDTGSDRLVVFLQNQGFLQSKVVSKTIRYDKNEKDIVDIKVNLDEGPLTRIQTIDFRGVTSVSDSRLFKLLSLKPGSALQLKVLEEGIAKIKKYYNDEGFLEMRFLNDNQNIIQYNLNNTLANLTFDIYEGPKIIIQSITVEGAKKTKEYVIRKELEFNIGDVLTPKNVSDSVQRLQRLGLFASVEIDTVERDTSIANRTVVVRVTERNPGQFNMGGGFSTERRISVRSFAGFTYRNLFQKAHVISSRLEVTTHLNQEDAPFIENRLVTSYLYPYLFNTRTRGRLSLFHEEDRGIGDFNDTFIRRIEGLISLEQDFNTHFRGAFNLYRLFSEQRFNILTGKQTTLTNVIASLGPRLEIDYRDHPFNPTRGSFTRLSFSYSDPALGSTFGRKFYRADGGVTGYLNLGSRWVFANSFQAGYIQNLDRRDGYDDADNTEIGVPYTFRGFFLGGPTTIRGFNINERFPLNPTLGIEDGEDYPLKTEAASYLLKSEIRFPIYNELGGALFYDGGFVRIGDLGKQDDTWRDAAGLALRYLTPVGAVNAEVGYKLDRKEGEDEAAFHLSIGTF